MKNTFVITKLKTTNVGNQALTQELIDMFINHHPNEKFIFQGRPLGLDGYTVDRLHKAKDPIQVFEKWAQKIARLNTTDYIVSNLSENVRPQVELINFSNDDVTLEKFKSKYLRPIKRYLSRYQIIGSAYKERLRKIKSSKTLIYSGAGEIGDYGVFLRQLLEIRVAQILGLETAIVNQSVVLKTKLFHQLTGHVYSKLDHLVVRGEVTKRNLISYGVDGNKIRLAPDTAFKTDKATPQLARELAHKYNITDNTVGINITNWFKTDLNKLERTLQFIRDSGYKIMFITNEPFEDRNFGQLFEEKYGIPFISDKLGYKDYAALLSNLAFMISARLHSNVLSLTAGTAIIPIEGNVFKTTELLQLAKYPINVISPSSENWEDTLHAEVQNVISKKYNLDEYFSNVLPEVQRDVTLNATWLNEQG